MTAKLSNLNMPNVEVAPKEWDALVQSYKLHDKLLFVAQKLATARLDKWRILAYGNKLTTTNENGVMERVLQNIAIVEKDEKLGSIKMNRRWTRSAGYEDTYAIYSDRIHKQRGGQAKETAKPKVAVKIALEYFAKKSPKELLRKANSSLVSDLGSQQYTSGRHLDNEFNRIRDEALAFVLEKSEEFVQRYPKHKAHMGMVVEACENKEIIESVASIKNDVLTVLFTDGDMVVAEDGEIKVYGNDGAEAPEHIRRKIGLLKLVNDSQIIRDIGIRVDENTFGITPEVKQ